MQECKEAHATHGAGLSEKDLRKSTAKIADLTIMPCVFQSRGSDHAVDRHVKNLGVVVRRGDKLDPIKVFPIAGMRVVIDGHCRLEALRNGGRRQVDISWERGSFSDALAYSLASNAKDKLPYQREDKWEGAWRLAVEGSLSQRMIARTASVSLSTVTLMVNALKDDPERHDKTWADVKTERRAHVERREDWEDIQRRKIVERLRKEFGSFPDKSPDLFLDALREAYPRIEEVLGDEVDAKVEEEVGSSDF